MTPVPDPAAAAAGPPATGASTPFWTPERIRALGPVTTVPIAASIFGLSRSVAYDLIHTGRFPVPVLRFGHRYRIPVAAILAALHLQLTDDPTPDTGGDLTDATTHALINHTQSPAAPPHPIPDP